MVREVDVLPSRAVDAGGYNRRTSVWVLAHCHFVVLPGKLPLMIASV